MYGLFLEISKHDLHIIQDVDHRLLLERHMELFVDHAVRFYIEHQSEQTHTGSLASTIGVVDENICDHVRYGDNRLLNLYLGVQWR